MDSILILGGGTMQLPALRAARRLGLTLYVVDADSHAPGALLADHFEPIDLKEKEVIAEFARGIPNLRAVFTAGTDFSLSVAHVSEKLGLPGIPEEVARNASEKGLMRERFRAEGVPSPRFTVIDPEDDAADAARKAGESVGYPGVIKPVDNMGARGVRTVRRTDELISAVGEARRFAREGRVIYEEEIRGREFSIDGLVYRGKLHITGIADRHIYFPPYFVEMGHTLPATLGKREEDILRNAFAAGVEALGIDNGGAKGDLFLREDGSIAVGEIAARLSGGYMSGWTYPFATGVDLTEAGIRLALGEDPAPHLSPRKADTSAERAIISIPGIVETVEGEDRLRELPGVRELFLRVERGSRVAPPRNNVEKCGNIIVTGGSREEAVSRAAVALQSVTVRLRPAVEMTDDYLFGAEPQKSWAPYPWLLLDARESTAGDPAPGEFTFPKLLSWKQDSLEAGALLVPENTVDTMLRRLPKMIRRGTDRPTADPGHHWSGSTLEESLEAVGNRGILREHGRGTTLGAYIVRRAVSLGGLQGVVYIWDTLKDPFAERSLKRWCLERNVV